MNHARSLILLGKTGDLAFAELEILATRFGYPAPERLTPQLALISGEIDAKLLTDTAGGVVKVFIPLNDSPEVNNQVRAEAIVADLNQSDSAHLALSQIGTHEDLKELGSAIKAARIEGKKPHFRLLRDVYESAGITTKYQEYVIIKVPDQPSLWKTVAVQDLYYWSKKDFHRPQSDPKSGMMPPKIARMMINLGLGSNQPSDKITVFDPFCGSGTTIMEALDLGCQAIGSDLSQKAIDISTANLTWFSQTFSNQHPYSLHCADATHLSSEIVPNPVDTIVFEGYLGSPHPDISRLDNILKGLLKLYTGVLKELRPYLKSQGILVCALPQYQLREGVKNLDHLIDDAGKLGYTLSGRFTYGRPQALVKRVIYVLQKT